MEVTVEREHAAAPEGVFSRLADLSSVAKMIGMEGAHYPDGEQGRVGGHFTCYGDTWNPNKPDPVALRWEITAFDPPQKFAAKMPASGASFSFDLEERPNGGCLIRLTIDDRPDAADNAFDRLVFRLMQLVPSIARKASLEDARKNIARL